MTPELEVLFDQLLALDPTPLILAVIIGGSIGFEREVHGRPAGLRTHVLVCLSSTVLILLSRRLPEAERIVGANLVLDPNRLAAGIVTGIGFLGAATVVRAGDLVRGITTGACIWSVAALGIALGNGAYGLAVSSTVVILAALVVLDIVERGISPVIYRRILVRGRGQTLDELSASMRGVLRKQHVRVQDVSGSLTRSDEPLELVLHVRCRKRLQGPRILDALAAEEGVTSVEWG